MIKHYYKDVNAMADIYERHDGTRYAFRWGKGAELVRLGKIPASVISMPGGMQYFAEHYEKLIVKYGDKI